MRTIEKRVEEFCEWLSTDETLSNNEDYKKMILQIEKYCQMLFADPIIVDTPKGRIAIQPQRTNNILEQLIILDGKETLEERFAEIDIKIVRKQLLELQQDSVKIPRAIKKIIKMPDLPEALVALFTS